MYRLLMILVISSVESIEKDLYNNYKELCLETLDRGERISDVVKDHSFAFLDDHCSHSVGFHFNTELCQSFEPQISKENTPRNFSAFLSDNDKFLYIYFFANITVVEGSPKLFKVNIEGSDIGYFDDWNPNFSFVVWIKEKLIYKSIKSYDIVIRYEQSGQKFMENFTTEQLNKQTEQQKLVIPNITSKGKLSNLSFELNSSVDRITIKDSYFIICGQKINTEEYDNTGCKAVEENGNIRCQCKRSSDKSPYHLITIVLILFWMAFLVIVTFLFMQYFAEIEKIDKTVFHMDHNCNYRNAKYKYKLKLRLAKSTIDFDLQNVTIDVEFLTLNNESIAPNFRFKANPLERRGLIDISLVMYRLTKMPELKKIRCSHSGKVERKICLLGVYKYYLKGEVGDIEWYKIVKNIYRNERIFILRKYKAEEGAIDPEEQPLKYIKFSRISLSALEVISILFVDILFMALISSLITFESIDDFFGQMLTSVLVTTLLGIIFNITLFVLFYKCLLLIQMRFQTKMDHQKEMYCLIFIRGFYVFWFVLAVVFTGLIIGYRPVEQTFIVFRWFAVVLLSSALMVIIWKFTTYLKFKSPQRQTETTEATVSSASYNESMF